MPKICIYLFFNFRVRVYNIYMQAKIKTFLLGIGAGAAIGVGSFLFTLCSRFSLKELGSALFVIGLFTVCFFGLFLYTGKIGYFIDNKNKKSYALDLLVGYIGNIVGAVLLGYLLRFIFNLFNSETLVTINKITASRMIDLGKGGSPFIKQLGTSFFCGVLVYLAVHFWKKPWNFLLRTIILVLCVFLFVYLGFEHCIANMFYFSYGNAWNLQSLVNILVVTIGNTLGAFFTRSIVLINK